MNKSLVALLLLAAQTAAVSVYLCGDSTTAKGGGGSGTQGWGEYLKYSLTGITVVNKAMAGRSARSYYREGRFTAIANLLSAGDFVIIEFGHNDGGSLKTDNGRTDCGGTGDGVCYSVYNGVNETVHSFAWYYKAAAKLFKAKGANVIFASQTPNNPWESGTLSTSPSRFAGYAKTAGTEASVPYIDHYNYSIQFYGRRTYATVMSWFTVDHVHTNPPAAAMVAQAFVRGLVCSGSTLKAYVKNSTSSIEGSCIGSSSTTCSVTKTCSSASQTCGSLWNGCNTVQCGNCSSTAYCNGTQCIALDSLSEWSQTQPDTYTSLNWKIINSYLILTNYTLPTKQRLVKYVGSQSSWMSSTVTTISVNVWYLTEGTVGLGARLSGTTYLGWYLSVANTTLTAQFCKTVSGTSTCTTGATGIAFSTTTANNFTIRITKVGSNYLNEGWLSGTSLGTGVNVSATTFSTVGNLFVATKGTSYKWFTALTVRSTTAVHVALAKCMSTSSWVAFVKSLLGSTVTVSARGTGEDANCNTTRRSLKRDSDAFYKAFDTLIDDDMASYTPSSQMASIFEEATTVYGAGVSEGIDIFALSIDGATAAVAGSTSAAALSTGAIVGIAVGSAAGAVAVAGAAVVAVVKIKGSKDKEDAEMETPRVVREELKKAMPSQGVDVMNATGGEVHSSITARGVAQPIGTEA